MIDQPLRSSPLVVLLALVAAAALFFVGCERESVPPNYVARVGDRFLQEEDIQRMLESMPLREDSLEVRQQLVDQWITSEVLYREALRRGLQRDPDVQRRLQESERTVLVNSLLTEMYDEHGTVPSATEMQAYFERHKDQLRLRESFVRVRYLRTETRAEAEEARRAMQQADTAARDSVWSATLNRLGVDVAGARQISTSYHPESRLFAELPGLQQAVAGLGDGQTAPVVEVDSSFHVVQLAERVPPGTIPEPQWIEDELARRLIIQGRKQLYARQVQRLRNEALVREDLEIK